MRTTFVASLCFLVAFILVFLVVFQGQFLWQALHHGGL
jgi:hypothetical protein